MNRYWKLAVERQVGKIAIALAFLTSIPAFAATGAAPPGTLVVSVEGCGAVGGTCTSVLNGTGSGGSYGDNQAAPLTLFYYPLTWTSPITAAPTVTTPASALALPQAASGANLPVSSEYGSSSEASVQLSGAGQYLTIMGYGINANTFNANPNAYSAAPNAALAQSSSLTGQSYTPIPRVVTLIDANGNVNSSTALFNIFDTNNPRSAYTADGTQIYVSGQGTGSDTTSGVFLTTAGAANIAPTPITGPDSGPTGCTTLGTCTLSQDTRFVQIDNGTLYVSTDSKSGGDYHRAYVGTLGDPPATTVFTCTGVGAGCGTGYGPFGPAEIAGLVNTGGTGKYTINSAGNQFTSNGNNLNVGFAVNLDPHNFFFATPNVLYVADTGSPKNDSNGPDTTCTTDGGTGKTVGDGGLQKWVLNPTVTAGVVNTGSTSTKETVTSATSGAFTQGQVGFTITDSDGYIPAGTTIASVSGAGKSVTMSASATGTDANDMITVSGWSLAYTLYNGLGLVLNSDCNPSATTNGGTTGLLGVTGYVSGGVAYLFATNYTVNDLDPTYLYGITDTLATTAMVSPGTLFTKLDTAPSDSNFKGVSFGPKIPTGYVEITSSPSGLAVGSTGANCAPNTYSTPVTLNWTGASSCQLSLTSPQSGPTGTQYAFSQWQDGSTGLADTFTPPTGTVYTATFNTQYLLTTSQGTGGSVSAGGYVTSGTNATITATPSAGYYFVNFTGTTNSTSPSLTLTMNAPQTITANFAPQTTPTITWAAPSAITFGGALSSIQLDATASVPGTFVYTPPAGTVLPVGAGQTLSVAFTPNSTEYTTANGSTTITVNAAPPAASGANLVVTRTLTRSSGTVYVTLTIANSGGSDADNVVLTTVKVGSDSATPLPQSIGTIAAGTSAQATVSVPGTVGNSGAASSMTLSGAYAGGTFSSSARITLP